MVDTLALPTVEDRLDRIEAVLRQLGFTMADLAAQFGEARGELAPRPVPAPRRPGHLRALPDPAARAPMPQSWAAHQQASAAAFEAATQR